MDRRLTLATALLAMIQTLEQSGHSFEQIRLITLDVARSYVQPKNAFQAWLKRLPVRLLDSWIGRIIINSMKKRVSHLSHPAGFKVEIITDKSETYGLGYGVNILECGICKLFHAHQADTYAKLLCEVDHITTQLAGLEMIRSGTLATGAPICDFRYRKKK
jgi:hypothetical protein